MADKHLQRYLQQYLQRCNQLIASKIQAKRCRWQIKTKNKRFFVKFGGTSSIVNK
ncbi:hypothetical protein NXU97_09355 [Bacteroides xylanisolvens]|uniref:hypothetical protein n=1 Tax=Bacteroides xylanisolvens TaxID=371601 RepID=UPI0018644134|nr:hypothetical protein [Bacteroides xylanisolvens]MBO1718888.1 hypothetical protein [Bacteroides xylanisolvens]MBT9893099.1 hypothetical protein [Bacteroides xylanisolvens]MCS3333920.1 hypothetical protein [Bacteroides xylanisolvens]